MEGSRVFSRKAVAWEKPELHGTATEYEAGWRAFCVGSRDEAYAELERRDCERARRVSN
jgi:hypothetical protein